MQVYRGMDIGTAKPTLLERRGIPHHLIDVADPGRSSPSLDFRRLGRSVLSETTAPVVIVTGGSGLHFRALVDPLSFAPTDPRLRSELEATEDVVLVEELLKVDPVARSIVDLANPRRVVRAVEIYRLTGETPSSRAGTAVAEDVRRYVPEIDFSAVGVDPGARSRTASKCGSTRMRAAGLIDEVRALSSVMGRTARNAVGYKEILEALSGEVELR